MYGNVTCITGTEMNTYAEFREERLRNLELELYRQRLIRITPDRKKDIAWLDYCRAELQKYAEITKK